MEQSNKKFDVLIPVARKDTSFVKNVVTYINKFTAVPFRNHRA